MIDAALLGVEGVLVIGTRGTAGMGEVQVQVNGSTELYLAWSAEPLGKGARVVIVNSRGARTVDVEPVEHFTSDAADGAADAQLEL